MGKFIKENANDLEESKLSESKTTGPKSERQSEVEQTKDQFQGLNVNEEHKKESIRTRMQRIIQELGVPQEDIKTMEDLLRVIKTLPDSRYTDAGIVRSKLEVR